MSADDWKDGISRDGAKEYAEYIAEISKQFMDALQSKGFSREEALRLTIAIVPTGMVRGRES